MTLSVISIGIIFNALACGFVSAIALALVIFLHGRWAHLDLAMKAFTWFWLFTSLIWAFSSIRYILTGFGYTGQLIGYLDINVQAAVFFGGPSLFYYVILRVFKSKRLANILAVISFILGLISLWFVLSPNGLPVRDVTDFSTDSTINSTSFAIFSVQISVLIFLLLYNIISGWRYWRQDQNQSFLYESLYSLSILVYVILGSIDESKIITGWPLIAFRLLYSGSFLFAYLVIMQDEEAQRTYFADEQLRPAAT
ncbi:hypothetical protein A3H10_00210 [Candidatus Uhrbacteria bacterium RIFCSPLOWO2_12_FULL_46_10]|uniref:Histidine kinase N-terminal 7TM region domain-containing protein n=1 Tax=Candidatus Uhrbacteria bacterium RIFCSPLOWO2_01_FULL_47_25 TaxID=1802402 RepID=A0A1F7UVY7_9BACT|nr:MAG: hypothetical protein UX68_C0018G0014 [Parcubacteria group bacterium GW2011_GWA2_46_9]OGL58879.1 MAG: hypothetical protein A2752_04845 [Candidatus Uhrbacteria bacterium RIFCSPHIGHO2_01_FULL_46_23]OGL69403.1 MAG: hypothetical protein A3D60_01000 [Candidatus Uhrbacteria bacterium RIFCSPHIGHO2_02_FULL_47_29]OGL76794.1 MAG: hypothetical protein A3E96_01645 [Candidatus Uhrbacteria bacterium RIFCSPHIGHO2_12_FULL_46_13]OGL82435.1 MAG: hypothetical protein A2936_03190 [Candidatus Uhrbacteria bac